MMFRVTLALMAGCLSQAAYAQSYSCEFDTIYALSLAEGKVSGSPIHFGDDSKSDWTFELVRGERDVEIVWPSSPLQFEGKSPSIQTGPTSFATFIVGRGPCMLTEGHCGGTLHYAEQVDGTLLFHFQPIALTRFSDGRREPMKVLAQGKCDAVEPGA